MRMDSRIAISIVIAAGVDIVGACTAEELPAPPPATRPPSPTTNSSGSTFSSSSDFSSTDSTGDSTSTGFGGAGGEGGSGGSGGEPDADVPPGDAANRPPDAA